MRDIGRFLAGAAALAAVFPLSTACSKDKDSSSAPEPTTEVVQTTEEPEDPHKMDITWLADYDLNPGPGEARSPTLALFEEVYGGSVNYVYVSAKELFTKYDMMLAGGEEVDMLPYMVSDFPNGTLKKRYQPLDPYYKQLEMDTELWSDMKDAVEMFKFGGAHYVIPYSVSSPVFLTYSRKITEGEKLGDPYTLYKEGKWDWKAFTDIMDKFIENTPKRAVRYGIQGSFGEAMLYSTGHTVVKYENGKFVNNIADPEIAKAEELMLELAEKKLYFDPQDFPASFPSNHSTLFYAMSDWALGASNGANRDMDLMVVPFPKPEGSDKYYFNGSYNAKMLAANSTKGEAVATYIKCERLAASSEKYAEAEKQAALAVKNNVDGDAISFVTEEQYDAVKEMCDLKKFAPVFDFGYGMGDRMYGFGEYTYETRGIMNNLTTVLLNERGKAASWEALREAFAEPIDREIALYN